MKAVILSRVSTEEQKEAGNSLPSQLFRLKKYTNDKELEVIKEFEFDESAYKTKRQEFSEVLKLIQNSKEPIALCCDKIDRLIRNYTADLASLESLRQQGRIELHFPSDNIVLTKDSPAADLFRFTIGVSLAKYYSDSIRDNVKRANENKLRNGEWPSKATIGYINVTLESEKKWIEIDPPRAELVIKLFEWYSTGNYSMTMLRKRIEREGLHLSLLDSRKLNKSEIDRILKNPFYYGVMNYDGKLYPHSYKPIISKELFDRVQEIKLNWNKKPFKYGSKPFLYRGLLECANCGCRITFEHQKGKYIYGHCTNFYKNCPNVVWVKEEEITDQVKELLKGISLSESVIKELVDELRSSHKAKSQYHERALGILKTEYDKLQNRLERMYDDKLDGSITQETYDNKLAEYKAKQQTILSEISRHTTADKNYYIEAGKLLDLASRASELFESSKPEQKRELLKFVLQNSKLDGRKLLPILEMPFDSILLANKTGNWRP